MNPAAVTSMEEIGAALAVNAVLLASLVALTDFGTKIISSVEVRSQPCCRELDKLVKVFPKQDEDCLVEACVSLLSRMRTNHTSSSLPGEVVCQKFVQQKLGNVSLIPNARWKPDGDVTTRNVLRVMKAHNWQKCVIVYDGIYWTLVRQLTSHLGLRHIKYVMFEAGALNSTSLMREMLSETLNKLDIKQFLLLTKQAGKVFQEAEDYDRTLDRTSGLRMFTRWIVVTSPDNKKQTAKAAHYFDNVAAIVERLEIVIHNDDFIECARTDISSLMYLSSPSPHANDVIREFQSVTEVREGDTVETVNDAFPNIRYNFNQRQVTVGTKQWDPFVKMEVTDNGTIRYSGLCLELLNELARGLNFTYIIREPPPEEGWGNMNDSGHWEGLVGLLHKKEVDMVVAPMSFSNERALVMDATYPFMTNHLAAVFRKPDPGVDKWKTFLRPFQGPVLVCLGAALVLATLLVYVTSRLSPVERENERQTADDGAMSQDPKVRPRSTQQQYQPNFPGPSPGDGFWFLYGALLSQGWHLLPRSTSGRILVASWWLFSVVLGATYSGNLVAFLTVQPQTRPFHSLQQMLQQGTHTWGTMAKTTTHTLIMNSEDSVLREIGNRLQTRAISDPALLSLEIDVHMRRLRSENYVFLTDLVSAEMWVRQFCDLDQVVDYASVAIPYTVTLPRGSAFTHLVDHYVMRIVEAGLVEKWKRVWLADELFCGKSSVSDSPRISVADVQSVLYMSAIGGVLALVALSCELAWQHYPYVRCAGVKSQLNRFGPRQERTKVAETTSSRTLHGCESSGTSGARAAAVRSRRLLIARENGWENDSRKGSFSALNLQQSESARLAITGSDVVGSFPVGTQETVGSLGKADLSSAEREKVTNLLTSRDRADGIGTIKLGLHPCLTDVRLQLNKDWPYLRNVDVQLRQPVISDDVKITT